MCKVDIKNGDTRIDPCMRKAIEILSQGLKEHLIIKACCCGHKKYPMTIVIENTDLDWTFELFSGVTIPRKRKFYIRDKKGIYHIPEVTNKK
jgi:hypothetical protein